MVRLIMALLLLAASLLVMYKAPMHFLWLLAVVITNYPYILMLLSSMLFVSCLWAAKYKFVVMLLSLAALFIYTLPIIAAYKQNSTLPAQLQQSFRSNNNSKSNKPFSFIKMFTGIGIKQVGVKTLTYKITDGVSLTLDYYPSSSANASSTIVVVHGGSWESGDSKQFIPFNHYFANKGYNVAAINYRLAPAYKSPAPMEDTKAAMQYLTEHAQLLNIDTTKFILLGRSAGAQIALVEAYSNPNPNIKGIVDFYGPADMVWGGQVKGNNLMLNTNKIYKEYFGGLYNEIPQVFEANSACSYLNVTTLPTLIIHGKTDAMVSPIHSIHLNRKLDAFKIPHYFLSLPFNTHGLDYNINGPAGQVTTYAIEQFLNSVTK